MIDTGFCNRLPDGTHNAALHGKSASFTLIWTIIPTTAACLSSVAGVTSALTHEMVEAFTDPDPNSISGWGVPFGAEIGDLCDKMAAFAGIAADLRAILAVHVALKLVDKRRLRPARSHGKRNQQRLASHRRRLGR